MLDQSLLASKNLDADWCQSQLEAPVDSCGITETAPPQFVSATTNDANGNGKIDQLLVKFDEAMNTEGTHAGFAASGFAISSSQWATTTTLLLSLAESGNFDTGTLPDLTYDSSIGNLKDSNDNALGSIATADIIEKDGAAPIVTSQTPADGATGVIVSTQPKVEFSETVQFATIAGKIQLRTTDNTPIAADISLSTDAKKITIAPHNALDFNRQYYIWVSGIEDFAGNKAEYTTPENQEFTTEIDQSDSQAPSGLTVTQPIAQIEVENAQATYEVEGTINADADDINIIIFTDINQDSILNLGDIIKGTTTVTAGSADWSVTINLETGNNAFKVAAIDENNNQATATIPTIKRNAATPGDTTAPMVTSSSPSGIINDENPTIEVTTNEASTCEYRKSEFTYGTGTPMTANQGTHHTATVGPLDDSTHIYYVRCADTTGNKMSSSTIILFTIDTAGNFDFTLDLNKGWNTFTLPLPVRQNLFGVNEPDVATVLESLQDSNGQPTYSEIWYFDGTDWLVYSPTQNPSLNDFNHFTDTTNSPYYIHMLQKNRLQITS